MSTTAIGKTENAPQKVLRPLPPQEQVGINITTQANGSYLSGILKGIEAFSKSFSKNDMYLVEIKVEKLKHPEAAKSDGSS